MDYGSFVARICDDGEAAVREDYADDTDKREGSLEGFAVARTAKNPANLFLLLVAANDEAQEAFFRRDEHYWRFRCKAAEIELVCNVVSAALMNEGQQVIIQPTARGAMKAAEILGVKDAA